MNTKLIPTSKCLVALACVLLLGPGVGEANGSRSHDSRIKGIWSVRVEITNCQPGNAPGNVVFASFDAMNIFEADGTFLDTNAQTPATQSAHFGYWRHVRGSKYEFSQKFFLFDAAGATTGWRIVRHDAVLSRSGASFSSGGTAEDFNNDGVLTRTGCSRSTAIRFD